MSTVKFIAEGASKPLLASTVGFAMTYYSDDITPFQGAAFCCLSQMVSQIAWPIINNSFNNNNSSTVKKCSGMAVYVISCNEIPRALMEEIGSPLSHVSACSLFLTSTLLTGIIYKLGSIFLSARNNRHPLFHDAFMDGEIRRGHRS